LTALSFVLKLRRLPDKGRLYWEGRHNSANKTRGRNMRINKLLSLLGFIIVSSLGVNAHANTPVSCTWMSLGGASYPGGWTSVDGCFIGNPQVGPITFIAQRTKKNTGSCTISVYSPYKNIGSCQSPSFVISSASPAPASSAAASSVSAPKAILSSGSCGSSSSCWATASQNCTQLGGNLFTNGGNWICYAK